MKRRADPDPAGHYATKNSLFLSRIILKEFRIDLPEHYVRVHVGA